MIDDESVDDDRDKCKKTVVYTRVNGALHIKNCKNYKKVPLPTSTSPKCQCAVE